jgi:hypothetical protein
MLLNKPSICIPSLFSLLAFSFAASETVAETASLQKPAQTECVWVPNGTLTIVRPNRGDVVLNNVRMELIDPQYPHWYSLDGTARDEATQRTGLVSDSHITLDHGKWIMDLKIYWPTPPGTLRIADSAYEGEIGPDGLVSGQADIDSYYAWPPVRGSTFRQGPKTPWHTANALRCERPIDKFAEPSRSRLPLFDGARAPAREVTEPNTARRAVLPVLPQQDMTGNFATSFGRMTLSASGGAYATGNGRVSVTRISGNVMQGIWEQSSATRRCSDGRYRGTFVFTFAADGFEGSYGYCDDPPNAGAWNGKRLPVPGSAIQ